MKKIMKVKKLLEMYILHYWLFFIIVKKRRKTQVNERDKRSWR